MTRSKKRRLTISREIVIPVGTIARIEPNRVSRYSGEWVSVLIAHGKDHTSEWMMPLKEALALGLVEEGE